MAKRAVSRTAPGSDTEWKLPDAKACGRRESLVEFFARSPLVGSGINLKREADYGRDIDLRERR
jgi:hypothetical protein